MGEHSARYWYVLNAGVQIREYTELSSYTSNDCGGPNSSVTVRLHHGLDRVSE